MVTDPRLRLVQGTDLAEHEQRVLTALDSVRVILRMRRAPASAAAGIGLMVSLTARLFAHVEIDGDAQASVSGFTTPATELLGRLSWLRPPAAAAATSDAVIAIGDTEDRAVDLGVGGGVWTATLARRQQVPLAADTSAPHFGLQAAACLAVAELVKEVLAPLGLKARVLRDYLTWDLSNYGLSAIDPPPSGDTRNDQHLAIAGVGSVGTSVISALLSSPEPFVSSIDLIDPEDFDDRNPYRYPALLDDVVGEKKVLWARDQLAQAGVRAAPHPVGLAEWISQQARPGLSGVLVASPDTLDGRRDVADMLARETLSIGVAGMAFHVSRHHPGDGLACPYCEYVDSTPTSSQADVFAAHTGLMATRIRQLMQPGALLTAADVAASVAAGKITSNSADRLAGHRLDDLVARAYAEVAVPVLGQRNAGGQVLLAAPYVSALAGILAAVEVYKGHLGVPRIDRRVDVDLTGLPQGFVRRPAADSSGRCLCASPFRQRAAAALYEADDQVSARRSGAY
ncbi:hypothetical protein [Amycolatopsis sp. NBC_00438]|uniref:hypothetical protein n=1 Tax=Amycolatopsis sp. NBC_00438 TaxID=2903558 RepID=UPI002E1CD57D